MNCNCFVHSVCRAACGERPRRVAVGQGDGKELSEKGWRGRFQEETGETGDGGT